MARRPPRKLTVWVSGWFGSRVGLLALRVLVCLVLCDGEGGDGTVVGRKSLHMPDLPSVLGRACAGGGTVSSRCWASVDLHVGCRCFASDTGVLRLHRDLGYIYIDGSN